MRIGEQTLTRANRGIHVATVDATSGEVTETAHFNAEQASVEDLERFLISQPQGYAVALAARFNGRLPGGPIGSALRWLNAEPEMSVGALDGLALIGRRADGNGVAPLLSTGAAEAVVGEGPIPVTAEAAIGLLGFDWSAE
jgi:hypothetical protein